MRTLKFNVDGQILKPDPNCDFNNLVPGTENYIQAEFTFSKEWDGYIRIAEFKSLMGKEYPPQPLVNGTTCIIPAEALSRRTFKVRVLGVLGDMRLPTNTISVEQTGGNV